MALNQLTVFVENKQGVLVAITDKLAENNINIRALSIAETAEFGILRLIVDQPDLARDVLTESGVIVRISEVIAVAMDDAPGGAGGILHLLSEAGINVEYMYACVGRLSGKAIMIIRTDDPIKAANILHREGYGDINPAEVYRI